MSDLRPYTVKCWELLDVLVYADSAPEAQEMAKNPDMRVAVSRSGTVLPASDSKPVEVRVDEAGLTIMQSYSRS